MGQKTLSASLESGAYLFESMNLIFVRARERERGQLRLRGGFF